MQFRTSAPFFKTMKLYIITRSDLPAGARAAQACHAMRQWSQDCREDDAVWFAESNTLVLLETADETALEALLSRARAAGVANAEFREPDFQDALTAIAIGWTGARLVSNLPLALKEGRRA